MRTVYAKSLNRGKIEKGAWWMPRLTEAKKDVVSCEKPRVGANGLRSADFRMGQPGTLWCHHARTRGTETSEYPQEEKTTVIPPVVASDRGGAQTGAVTAAPG